MPTIKSIDSLLNESFFNEQHDVTAIRKVMEDLYKDKDISHFDLDSIINDDKTINILTYRPNDKMDVVLNMIAGHIKSIGIYSDEIQIDIDGAEDIYNILKPKNMYVILITKIMKYITDKTL